MWRARWDEARAAATKAEDIAAWLGDRNSLEQCRLVLMSICHMTGDFEGAVLRADEIILSAQERGDLRHLGASLIAAIISLAPLGLLDEAEARLARFSAVASTPDAELCLLSCRALLLRCRGDLEAAVMPAEQAASKVSLMMPMVGAYTVYTVAIDVHLARWEAARGKRPAIAAEAERAAARALRGFFRCSLRFELCAPFYHELKGRAHRLAGSPRRARASLERALDLARRLQMPFPEARAHVELARLSPPGAAARAAHFDAAEELFEQMGCQPDLEVCRALRGRV